MGGAAVGDFWVWRDQARMTPAMALDWDALAAEFYAVWGVHLLGSSGVRTDEEQLAIWYERYTLTPNGRRVYDTRWWQGRLWYRISSAGTVAQPKTSNHQIDVASGRRGAVDVRDSGGDPGVTRFGTARNDWLRANAPRFNFNSDEGVWVNEAWHYRYTADPWRAVPAGSGSDVPSVPSIPEETYIVQEDDMANPLGYAKGDKADAVYAIYTTAGANNPKAETQGGVYCARRYVTKGELKIALAAGYKLETLPQAELDEIPKVYGSA